MVRLAVSSISAIWSSLMVKVTCPLLSPSAMIILVGIVPVKSAAVATPVKARSTVWSPATGRAAVAVTVMLLVVPPSLPVVGLTERLTVGAGMVMVKLDAAEVSTPPLRVPPLSWSCTCTVAVPGVPLGV
ncbi:hypothetical protein [Microcoleus sp. Pol17_C1]|uniref:hypothetical protein n=1 Tax=unclassified Microcoleus TaxID=2642155 RepID=UPI002FD23D21